MTISDLLKQLQPHDDDSRIVVLYYETIQEIDKIEAITWTEWSDDDIDGYALQRQAVALHSVVPPGPGLRLVSREGAG